MLRNLLIAVALIALLCALLVFVAKRSDEGTPTQGAAAGPVVGEREQSVARWLREMGERSRALMPQELGGVALGMSLDELRRARPRATHDPRAHGPQGEGLWAENADGVAWETWTDVTTPVALLRAWAIWVMLVNGSFMLL